MTGDRLLTIGKLRQAMKDLPDDMVVVVPGMVVRDLLWVPANSVEVSSGTWRGETLYWDDERSGEGKVLAIENDSY